MSECGGSLQIDVDLSDMDSSIANRRKKREDTTSANKFHEYQAIEEAYRQKKVPQKSQERGWYVVEAITGHRIAKHKKRDFLELQVQWENYDEPTWEGFTHFVKETTPIVERYIIQKSLMKPL